MHKVFISYHHHVEDQPFKDCLATFGEENKLFKDGSVKIGDIPEDWSDEKIREEIRDNYLKDTTVTILLVGRKTKHRKHVDWELYSSMYDGKVNKKSGILVILLPSAESIYKVAAHDGEKENVFPEEQNWITITSRAEMKSRYPYMPDRILDNLVHPGARISVINWKDLNPQKLKYMIDAAYNDRANCDYDLSRPMRRNNS